MRPPAAPRPRRTEPTPAQPVRRPAREPVGRTPVREPAGRKPAREPVGRKPTREPVGRSPERQQTRTPTPTTGTPSTSTTAGSTELVRPAATGARLVLPRRRSTGDGASPPAVSTGLAARMAERAAADRRLLLRRGALTLLVLSVLTGIAWVLLASPLLALDAEQVEISGVAAPVDPAAVVAAVEPEVGTPLLRVDTAAVATRIAEIPTVREAQVSRSWPDGLAVTVVPRVPVAAASAEGGWVLVDVDGVQVATAAEAPEGLPEVTVPLSTSEETAPALDAVLTVLGVLPVELLAQVAQAGATTPEQVTLTLDDGATVRWGSAEESELKAEVLGVLRQEPAAVYDVTVPRTPTTSA